MTVYSATYPNCKAHTSAISRAGDSSSPSTPSIAVFVQIVNSVARGCNSDAGTSLSSTTTQSAAVASWLRSSASRHSATVASCKVPPSNQRVASGVAEGIDVRVGAGVSVGPGVLVGSGVSVGANVFVGSGGVVGSGSSAGSGSSVAVGGTSSSTTAISSVVAPASAVARFSALLSAMKSCANWVMTAQIVNKMNSVKQPLNQRRRSITKLLFLPFLSRGDCNHTVKTRNRTDILGDNAAEYVIIEGSNPTSRLTAITRLGCKIDGLCRRRDVLAVKASFLASLTPSLSGKSDFRETTVQSWLKPLEEMFFQRVQSLLSARYPANISRWEFLDYGQLVVSTCVPPCPNILGLSNINRLPIFKNEIHARNARQLLDFSKVHYIVENNTHTHHSFTNYAIIESDPSSRLVAIQRMGANAVVRILWGANRFILSNPQELKVERIHCISASKPINHTFNQIRQVGAKIHAIEKVVFGIVVAISVLKRVKGFLKISNKKHFHSVCQLKPVFDNHYYLHNWAVPFSSQTLDPQLRFCSSVFGCSNVSVVTPCWIRSLPHIADSSACRVSQNINIGYSTNILELLPINNVSSHSNLSFTRCVIIQESSSTYGFAASLRLSYAIALAGGDTPVNDFCNSQKIKTTPKTFPPSFHLYLSKTFQTCLLWHVLLATSYFCRNKSCLLSMPSFRAYLPFLRQIAYLFFSLPKSFLRLHYSRIASAIVHHTPKYVNVLTCTYKYAIIVSVVNHTKRRQKMNQVTIKMPRARQKYTDKYGMNWEVFSVRQTRAQNPRVNWIFKEITLITSDAITDDCWDNMDVDEDAVRFGKDYFSRVIVKDKADDIDWAWQEFVQEHGIERVQS